MKRTVLTLLFLALCFSIPLSQLISARLLLVSFVFSFFLRDTQFSFNQFIHQSWDLLLLFGVLVIGLFYTENMSLGWRQLETNLSLVGVPFLVYNLGNLSKGVLSRYYYAFGAGVIVASLICVAFAISAYTKDQDPTVFFYSEFTRPIDSQPTYFAYYLIFVITVGLYKSYYELSKKEAGLHFVVILFLFAILLMTGGQTAFISLLFIFSFFLNKYLLQRSAIRETLTFGLIIVLLVAMFSWMSAGRSALNDNASPTHDYWERSVLWKSAIDASDNYLLGVGTGDYTDVLNNYYRGHEMQKFADSNLNAHNEYLQLFLSNGFLGLLVLLFAMARPLYWTVKSQDLLGTIVLFPFLVYGITEVFLGRYQGVIFFALLHQVAMASAMQTRSALSWKVDKL